MSVLAVAVNRSRFRFQERKGQGAKVPGDEMAGEQIGHCPIGRFAQGCERLGTNVAAIFWERLEQSVNSYRPISLTSHIGKVFDSIIKDVLLDYIHKNDLLNDSMDSQQNDHV